MTPFYDKGLFNESGPLPTSAPSQPNFSVAQGAEIRYGLNIIKRKNIVYISSGQWQENFETNYVDQQVKPNVLGLNQDILDYRPYNEQDERRAPSQVLNDEFITISDTLDYDSLTAKDGRVTVFNISARSYVYRDEIPYTSKGIKINDESIIGVSTGQKTSPFVDYVDVDLGIVRLGYFGAPPVIIETFIDNPQTSSLGSSIDYDDYTLDQERGSCGRSTYSLFSKTDSVSFVGLVR